MMMLDPTLTRGPGRFSNPDVCYRQIEDRTPEVLERLQELYATWSKEVDEDRKIGYDKE